MARFFLTSVATLALTPDLARAETITPEAPRADAVDSVVVTGRSLEQTLPAELARYGSDVAIIDAATLRANAYVDLAQALQMQTPGLYLAPRSGPFSYVDLSLQGSRTGDVLWLVDGVRINNRLYTSTSPADTLPASMIERVEVLKGGQGLFYGTQAAAGVINVVTRGFSDTPAGAISIGGDSHQGVHANLYGRGAIGGHHVVAWVSKDRSDGFNAYDSVQPSATARKRGYDVVSGGIKYGYHFNSNLGLNLSYQHTDAHLDYPGARLTKLSYNERDEDIASIKLDYTPDGPAQLFLKGYLHDWDSVYSTVNNVPGMPGATVTLDDNTYWGYRDYGASAMVKLRLNRGFEYEVGYDFQSFSGRDDVLLIASQSETVHAGVLQIRTTDDLVKNGRLAAGVRYNKTKTGETTIWNLSGRYDLRPGLFVEGLAGSAFILPSAEQLFAVDPCCAVGNRDLAAERSLNLNLAMGAQHGRFRWQATGFARKIDKLITDVYDQPAFPDGIYVNADRQVRVRGFELLAWVRLNADWNAQASYTRNRSRMLGASTQMERTPQQLAKASLTYAPESKPYGASAAINWTGAVYSTVSGFGRRNYGHYQVIDLAAHVFLDPVARRHRVTARLENALDQTYATRIASAVIDRSSQRFLYRNRGAPRTFQLTYSYDF